MSRDRLPHYRPIQRKCEIRAKICEQTIFIPPLGGVRDATFKKVQSNKKHRLMKMWLFFRLDRFNYRAFHACN